MYRKLVGYSYKILVKTGDQKYAGTDADISIVLYDEMGMSSGPHNLDKRFRNDFERGHVDDFTLKSYIGMGEIVEIELNFREKCLGGDWYCEWIKVDDRTRKKTYVFPVHRWMRRSKTLKFLAYDSHLPQHSKHVEQRRQELDMKRELYQYAENAPGVPIQVKTMPDEEAFSDVQKWDIIEQKFKLLAQKFWYQIWERDERFSSLDDIKEIFQKFPSLQEPPYVNNWNDDLHFGQQRVNGCNPKVIQLCTKIPEHFLIDQGQVQPFLNGRTLAEVINLRRLFIVDLKILEGIKHSDGTSLCEPLALFYANDSNEIRPVAIQLNQDKGPAFYPSDDTNLWTLVKMWYNLADASYHQSIAHLSSTHLLMEGISISIHRNLSPSHPIHRLLAPHFIYIMAINTRGLEKLVSPGGWVDSCLTIGREGMFQLMAKKHATFRLDLDGDFKEDLKKRGLFEDVLPNYYYRQDGLRIYDAIDKYVSQIVHMFYHSDEQVQEDYELQNWARELTGPRADLQGLGLQGIPGNGQFKTREELIQIFRIIIFTCSCEHAAVNFNQYDEYAFTPNYPCFLRGKPPSDKTPRTEQDIIDALPSEVQAIDAMIITKILSTRSTQPLGDFEIKYHHRPDVLAITEEFRKELNSISDSICNDLPNRCCHYSILDPKTVPNAISI